MQRTTGSLTSGKRSSPARWRHTARPRDTSTTRHWRRPKPTTTAETPICSPWRHVTSSTSCVSAAESRAMARSSMTVTAAMALCCWPSTERAASRSTHRSRRPTASGTRCRSATSRRCSCSPSSVSFSASSTATCTIPRSTCDGRGACSVAAAAVPTSAAARRTPATRTDRGRRTYFCRGTTTVARAAEIPSRYSRYSNDIRNVILTQRRVYIESWNDHLKSKECFVYERQKTDSIVTLYRLFIPQWFWWADRFVVIGEGKYAVRTPTSCLRQWTGDFLS